jgi:hypothetical protein
MSSTYQFCSPLLAYDCVRCSSIQFIPTVEMTEEKCIEWNSNEPVTEIEDEVNEQSEEKEPTTRKQKRRIAYREQRAVVLSRKGINPTYRWQPASKKINQWGTPADRKNKDIVIFNIKKARSWPDPFLNDPDESAPVKTKNKFQKKPVYDLPCAPVVFVEYTKTKASSFNEFRR